VNAEERGAPEFKGQTWRNAVGKAVDKAVFKAVGKIVG
jgi:hypothetical protein